MNDKKVLKKNSFVEGTIVATLSIFLVKLLGMLYVIPFYEMISVKGSALYSYAYNIYVIFLYCRVYSNNLFIILVLH